MGQPAPAAPSFTVMPAFLLARAGAQWLARGKAVARRRPLDRLGEGQTAEPHYYR